MALSLGPILRGERIERPERLGARFALQASAFLSSVAALLELPQEAHIHRLRPDLGLAVSLKCDRFSLVLRHPCDRSPVTKAGLPQVLITLPGERLGTFEEQLRFVNALRARRGLVPFSEHDYLLRAARSALAA